MSSPPPSPSARQDRIRVAQACNQCRDKKSKCDGSKPVCTRCRLKALDCHYGLTKKVRNQQVMEELSDKVAQYESMLGKTLPPQRNTSHASQKQATTRSPSETTSVLPTLMAVDSFSTQNTMSESPVTPLRTPADSMVTGSGSASNSNTNTNANAENWGRQWLEIVSTPPRQLVGKAVDAFLRASATLFTFFDDNELPVLFKLAYEDTADSAVSRFALAQLCAAAAVGCQYAPQEFDPGSRQALVTLAKLTLEECIEQVPLASMRMAALLCMYYTFEKRTAALLYADMGLRLAKMNRNETEFHAQPLTQWQRVFGSLVFLDCWLCATTGHLPSSHNQELYSQIILMGEGNKSISAVVQFEMVKIATLACSILQDVYYARFVSTTIITNYKNRLQHWLLELPDYMRLDYLLTEQGNPSYLRPIFLVHLLYMTTVILVYRRVLVELACIGRKWSDREMFEQTQAFLEPCLWTGRQVAKILEISLSQGYVLQNCWMFINSTYSTCNVLLYFIANRLLHTDQPEEISQDLAAAKQCLEVLAYCSQTDEAASQYLNNASTIYNNIIQIHQAMLTFSNTDEAEDELATREERLHQLISLTASFLIHPFDGGFRRDLNTMHAVITGSTTAEITASLRATGSTNSRMATSGIQSLRQEGLTYFFSSDFVHAGRLMKEEDEGKHKSVKSSPRSTPPPSLHGIIFGS